MTVESTASPSTDLRDTIKASEFIGINPRTLSNWRVIGKGPKYIKVGARVRYRTSDLLEWLDKHTHDLEPA